MKAKEGISDILVKKEKDQEMVLPKVEPASYFPYQCELCGKSFEDIGPFQTHISQHVMVPAENQFDEIKLHPTLIKQEPSFTLNFTCDLCEKYFTHAVELENHKRASHATSKVLVNKPNTQVKKERVNVAISTQEIRTTTTKKGRKMSDCKLCINCKSEKILPCLLKKCAEESNDSNAFEQTMEKLKASHATYKCDICGKSFFSWRGLQSHRLTDHEIASEINKRKTVCDICFKVLSSAHAVKIHMETVHNKSRKWKCDKCEKDFTQKGQLRDHKIAAHSNGKVYYCNQCEYASSKPLQIERHKGNTQT